MNRFRVPFLSALILSVFTASAFAQSTTTDLINWSDLVEKITTSVTTAMTSTMPLLGMILGAIVGWRLFRKFTGGRT